MNTAQVLAWLLCLALAFFACVLSMHNVLTNASVRRDIDEVKQELAALEEPSRPSAEQLARMRRTVAEIRGEIDEISQLQPSDRTEELTKKLADLDRHLGALERVLDDLAQIGGR